MCKITLSLLLLCLFISKCDNATKNILMDLMIENHHASCKVSSSSKTVTLLDIDAVSLIIRSGKYEIKEHEYRIPELVKVIGKSVSGTNSKKQYESIIHEKHAGTWNLTFFIPIDTESTIKPVYHKETGYFTFASCFIHVDVFGRDNVEVAVDNIPLNASVAYDQNYNARATYEYFDGEMVDISCSKLTVSNKSPKTISRIELHFKSYKLISIADPINLHVKLSAVDNNTFFWCIYGVEPSTFYKVRVSLKLKEPEDPELSIRVNGLKHKTSVLRYYYDEPLQIECEKSRDSEGILKWDINPRYTTENNTQSTSSTKNISISVLPKGLEHIELNCGIDSDTNTSLKPAMLKMAINNATCFHISGLKENHVLSQYNNETTTYIEYEYFDRQELTCERNKHYQAVAIKKVYWTSEKERFNSPNATIIVPEGEESDNVTIRCIMEENEAFSEEEHFVFCEIHIRLIKGVRKDPNPDTTSPAPESTTQNGLVSKDSEPGMDIRVIAAMIGAGCIILVIMCTTLVVRRKHTKKQITKESKIDYENLSPTSNNMDPPVQWNENHYAQPVDHRANNDTYSVPFKPTLEDLYSKPILKNKKHNPEPTYAEAGYSNNYAQVVPKLQRKKPVTDHYAELVLKVDGRDHGYVNSGATANESPYAEIGNYSDMKYENVFDNSRYGNTQECSEYAEPAYCEVSKIYKK